MKITPLFPRRPTAVLMMSLLASLTACGGGGGGLGSSTTSQATSSAAPADTTPDAFTAASVTNAELHTEVTSATITITGINQATPISISGGTYSINGGAYTDAAGTVSSGQTVTVKVTSSDKTNTAVSATLTVGGVSGEFTVTTAPDLVPDGFGFTALTGVTPSSVNTSDSITLAGVDTAVPISITGGEYAIDNGTYTSAAATLSSGQKVTVRLTASDKTNTATSATLTIGGVSGQFTATTAPDVTPDAFSFAPVNNVVPGSLNISAPITVAGVDVAVPISVSGGEYSIDNGAFTNTAGTVSSGQSVKVRATASNATTTDVIAALTIGGVSANYKITTLADTHAPTAQILFPPPVSMTEINNILVRGTASDDYSTITSVKVNGKEVTPKAPGDYSSWQVNVDLTAATDNTLTVTTTDSANNSSDNAAQIMVRQGDHKNAFPEGNNSFSDGYIGDLIFDDTNESNRLLVRASDNILSFSLATAKPEVFIDYSSTPQENRCSRLLALRSGALYCVRQDILHEINMTTKVDKVTQLSYDFSSAERVILDDAGDSLKLITLEFSDYPDGFLQSYDVSTGVSSVLSDSTQNIPNSDNPFIAPEGVVLDKARNRYLVTSGGQNELATPGSEEAVLAVDRATGTRTVLSSNNQGEGELFSSAQRGAGLSAVALDEANQRILVSEVITGKIFFVNLNTGERSIVGDGSMDNMPTGFHQGPVVAKIVTSGEYAFVIDTQLNGIYAIDLLTGKRVIFSKPASTR